MKAYKKMLAIVPIAVLSTSVLSAPVSSFAEETKTNMIKNKIVNTSNVATNSFFSPEQLENDMKAALKEQIMKSPGVDESSIQYNINITPVYVNSGNINIKAQADQYTDDGQIELLHYKNAGQVAQTQKTAGKTVTKTNTVSYSNTEGIKLGFGVSTKVKAEIPFLAEGDVTVKSNVEFDYNHTSSDTTSNTETVTFPEQSVVCIPGYTTTYTGIVHTAKFSGEYTGAVKLVGKVSITANYTDQYGGHGTITRYFDGDNILDKIYNRDVNIFASGKLPSYLEKQEDQVVIKSVKTTFKGVGGHQTDAQITLTPIDTEKPTVKMSVKEFQDPQVRAKLLQQ